MHLKCDERQEEEFNFNLGLTAALCSLFIMSRPFLYKHMSHHELLKGRYGSNIPGCLISGLLAAPPSGRLYEQLLKIIIKAFDQSRDFPAY